MLTRVSEMDTGGDAATPGPPNATSAMSADDAWGLKQGELPPWAHNREEILAGLKRILENAKQSPVSYLKRKIPVSRTRSSTRGPCGMNSHPWTATLH